MHPDPDDKNTRCCQGGREDQPEVSFTLSRRYKKYVMSSKRIYQVLCTSQPYRIKENQLEKVSKTMSVFVYDIFIDIGDDSEK